jgi:hypothetical protein
LEPVHVVVTGHGWVVVVVLDAVVVELLVVVVVGAVPCGDPAGAVIVSPR